MAKQGGIKVVEGTEKAKRTRKSGALNIDSAIANANGPAWATEAEAFDDPQAARLWLTANAEEGKTYRLVRVLDTFTPTVQTVRKVVL